MNRKTSLLILTLTLVAIIGAANLAPDRLALPNITPVNATLTCPTGGAANPCDIVSLDAMSRPTKTAVTGCAIPAGQFGVCDTLINPAVTNVTTFRVGAIVNASSAGAVNALYGWQYSITYDTSIVTPVGDPSRFCSAYPDCGEKAVWFGSQNNAGNVNWAGALNIGAGNPGGATAVVTIAEDPVTHVGKITIAWAFVAPSTPVSLTARSVLASVSFELIGKGVATFTIGDVIFSDITSTPFSGVIAAPATTCTALVCGAAKVTVTNDPPHAGFTASHVGTAYDFTSTSSDTDDAIKYGVWDFGDKTPFLNTTATTVTHDYGISGARTAPGAFNVTLRVVDTQGATGTARDAGGLPVTNIQPSHQFVNIGLVERAPQPAFIFTPSNPNAGQAVNFDASSSTYPSEPLLAGTAPVGGTGLVSSSAGDSACNLTIGVPCTLGYVDNNANGIFDPGVDTVVRGTDGTGLCNPAACDILAGPTITPAGQTIIVDVKISWLDANVNGILDSGEPILYDTSGNSIYDGIKTYSWDFGDGTTGTGITAAHTYNPTTTTIYPAKLTVTDNLGGTNTATKSVTVTGAPVQHPTSTTVSCTPSAVAPTQVVTCTATVADASTGPTPPTGVVTWSHTGTGSFNVGTCTLNGGTPSICSVNYTPGATGAHDISASYGGDTQHSTSSTTSPVTITVTLDSTTTTLVCTPLATAPNQAVSCTVTVTDTVAGRTPVNPTGTITWAHTGSGNFNVGACTLNGGTPSTCTVTYTPTAAGLHDISASYGGDPIHATSSSTTPSTIVVTLDPTTTTIVCTPTAVAPTQVVSCTATVTDTVTGRSPINPTGTVSWSHAGTGNFNVGTCTLNGGTPSTCGVSYTP